MKDILNREFKQLLSDQVRKEYSPVYKSLTEFRFTIADLPNVSSRVMSYWAQEGVLLEDFRDHKWRRFDMVSFIWLKVIEQLREFNIPLATIKDLAESMKGPDIIDSIMRSEELEEVIIEIGRQDGQMVTDVRELLDRPDVRESIKRELPSVFMILVLDAIIMRDRLSILVNRQGEFVPFKESYRKAYNKIPEMNAFLNSTYVNVSISGLLQEYFESQDPDFLAHELCLLTPKEAEVLNAIRTQDLTSVEIRYHNGEMDRIEITKKMKVNTSQRLYEIMFQEGYQDITLKIQDQKVVHCENTYKQKFKDLGTG